MKLRRAELRRAIPVAFVAATISIALPASAQLGGARTTVIGLTTGKFAPAAVTVATGSKVTFVWKAKVAHNVVIDAKHKSATQTGGVWTTSFDTAGVYPYKCTIHPWMKGEITVS